MGGENRQRKWISPSRFYFYFYAIIIITITAVATFTCVLNLINTNVLLRLQWQ